MLIEQTLLDKSYKGMAIFVWRVTWSFTYSPFKNDLCAIGICAIFGRLVTNFLSVNFVLDFFIDLQNIFKNQIHVFFLQILHNLNFFKLDIQCFNSIVRNPEHFLCLKTKSTGLPTKNETSETTVQNLYCLFSYIHDSLQL